jgi:predicted ArsR family transcriptional regulator
MDEVPVAHGVEAIGALAEPNRRALYDYVVEQREWVSREQAAAALVLGRGIASHHLDRLAEEGLLEVDFRRLNDRRGPGAGRPAKVYRRARSEIAVSLPARDYELAGHLLADAIEMCGTDDVPIEAAIAQVARSEGTKIGIETKRRIRPRSGATKRQAALFEELRVRGFEPELRDRVVVLNNCPFHQLAQTHTQLICGMNLCLLDGLLDELGPTDLRAELEPEDDSCCVRLHLTN